MTFKERYNIRKKERLAEEAKLKTLPEAVTESTTDLPPPEEFTAEQEEAAVKIQAGVRGMLARRSITRADGSPQAEHQRWLNPQEQLERDLQTISESISFAQLESHDGVWEACQRWLHPSEQLERDLQTVAEPVECAHLRERGPSLEEVAAAAAFSQARSERRAGSPPELASPAHSDISVASAELTRAPSPPARAPSIASVQSARASEVSLADQAPPSAHHSSQRADSLEAMSAERVGPPSRPATPPSPPTDILDGKTAGSQVELATEVVEAVVASATERAGSPPEIASPKHSDVELAEGRQSPGAAAAGRAGSPPEALTPQHSNVDVPGTDTLPEAGRAGSPAEEGAAQATEQ